MESIVSQYTYDPLGQLTAFTQSTGYGESYTYDKVGNMKQKVIASASISAQGIGAGRIGGAATGETPKPVVPVTLNMSYNKGNQLAAMQNGRDKLTYSYDKNGNMLEKALASREYGKLTDTYTYNSQDMISGYLGYDGFAQQFTYDANGMRLTKQEAGDTNRSTLEELLRGEMAGLPEIIAPVNFADNTQMQTVGTNGATDSADPAAVQPGFEWATTEYLYDITQQYYQVMEERASSKNGNSVTAYDYGLERIAAHSSGEKTSYVYDGRGSVAQTITVPTPGEKAKAALPDALTNNTVSGSAPSIPVLPQIGSFTYTAFGEQMGNKKISGFGYNAEYYDAATGMQNLRARQYEPAIGRFSQKDLVRGWTTNPLTLNRYLYVTNSPIVFVDPSGEILKAITSVVKVVTTVKNVVNTVAKVAAPIVQAAKTVVNNVVQTIKSAADSAKQVAQAANAGYNSPVTKALVDTNSKVQQAYTAAQNEIAAKEKALPPGVRLSVAEKDAIFARACAGVMEGSNKNVATSDPTHSQPTTLSPISTPEPIATSPTSTPMPTLKPPPLGLKTTPDSHSIQPPAFVNPPATVVPEMAQPIRNLIDVRFRVVEEYEVYPLNDGSQYNVRAAFAVADKHGNKIGIMSVVSSVEKVTSTNLTGYFLMAAEVAVALLGKLPEGEPNIFVLGDRIFETESTNWRVIEWDHEMIR